MSSDEVLPQLFTALASRMTVIEADIKHLVHLNAEQSVLLRDQAKEIHELKAIITKSMSSVVERSISTDVAYNGKECAISSEILKSAPESTKKRNLSQPVLPTFVTVSDDASLPDRDPERLRPRRCVRKNDVLIYSPNDSARPALTNISAMGVSTDGVLNTHNPEVFKSQANIASNEEWTEVRYKKRREISLRCVAGPSVTSLKAAEIRKHFHLWNMLSKAEDIKVYLDELCPQRAVTVEQLKTKNKYNSFKIGVPEDCFEKCFSINVWPENARVKHWINYRKRTPTVTTAVNRSFRSEVGAQ